MLIILTNYLFLSIIRSYLFRSLLDDFGVIAEGVKEV